MHIQQVVDVALRLLNERGLPDLSMRRVAAALEVQPSALYWHVSSKQHLLGLVADRILDSCLQLDDVVSTQHIVADAPRLSLATVLAGTALIRC